LARIAVRLTPSGGADRIDGIGADAAGEAFVKARVRAPPEDGKANAALGALLARELGVAKSGVTVVKGHAARWKIVEIEGVDRAAVAAWLARIEEKA
jgi:uncharacterized protein YggU (UPF0235/DUF167 family)